MNVSGHRFRVSAPYRTFSLMYEALCPVPLHLLETFVGSGKPAFVPSLITLKPGKAGVCERPMQELHRASCAQRPHTYSTIVMTWSPHMYAKVAKKFW